MKRDIRWFSLASLLIGILLMSLFVTNAGDDFFYATFAKSGFGHFIEAHTDHYLHTNGRCIVHILASVFLWLPHIFWKITNAIMWVAVTMNLYRLLNLYIKDVSKLRFLMFLLCGAFLTIHIEMAKESTLWLTGSFNYTYPLMMFTWYWYLLFTHERQSTVKLCVVGFLAAASMEQESALTVILTIGYFIRLLTQKQSIEPKLKKALLLTLLGAVSLFLAPGNLSRMGDEIGSSNGTFFNIFNGIDFMLNYSISSNYMIWLNLVFMTCCGVYLYRNRLHVIAWLLPFEIAALLITNHSGDFAWMGAAYYVIFYASRVYYFTAALGAAYVYFQNNQNPLPLIGLIFGIFSCAFIVFSPTLGARVILFAEIMVILNTVVLLSEIVKKQTVPYAVVHLLVLALSVWNVVYITHGFYKNDKVYHENVRLIEEWHKTGRGELHQKQYRNDAFEHSMPYNSDYHDGRYKEYFDIPIRIHIIWE